MAKRDPEKTRRNKEIDVLTEKIENIQAEVLSLTGYSTEHILNAKYGSKYAEYIDIKNDVIDTPEQFIALYLKGFLRKLESLGAYASQGNPYYDAFLNIKNNPVVLKWLKLFLGRTYLRNYEALSKNRPSIEEAEIWIGQENASYGLLVTPRFKGGQWENDKSEIRHFQPKYWTIGHALETGFVIPSENERIRFKDVDQYLAFFKNTLVRNSGSKHEMAIAKKYCQFVQTSTNKLDVPLLIPELRYGGKEKKHEYRLDFTVIDPYNLSKVGFELSPWSTHGELLGIKGKTQKAVNDEAMQNFEKEMKKLKAYFRKYKITVLVYTDEDLKNHENIFNEISKYLSPTKASKQLEFQVINDFLNFSP
jgi:hypothetical protein